jgi:hypothetical protein
VNAERQVNLSPSLAIGAHRAQIGAGIKPKITQASSRAELIEAVRKAREIGCSRDYWHTNETNAATMRPYDGVADRPSFVQYRKVL